MAEKKTKKHELSKDESSTKRVVKERVDYTKPAPNGKRRPYGGTGEGNPKHANVPQEDRCTARRARDGEPCTRLRVSGANVCGTHGGRAPQVMAKAMARLQNSADKLVQAELAIALDEEQPAPVRLAAMRDALDRAGLKTSDKVELAHSMKPWEQVMESAVRINRTAPPDQLDPAIQELQEHDDRY